MNRKDEVFLKIKLTREEFNKVRELLKDKDIRLPDEAIPVSSCVCPKCNVFTAPYLYEYAVEVSNYYGRRLVVVRKCMNCGTVYTYVDIEER